jgi:hypothetical protein
MATMSFKELADKTGRSLETAFHEFSQDVAERVVERTPVDTGFLRGSWFVAVNSDRGPKGQEDRSGSFTIASIGVAINSAQVGDVLTIGNNAEYAEAVEFGTARQRPRSMVRSVIRDHDAIMQRTAQRIRRR